MSAVRRFSPQWQAENAERCARVPAGADDRFVGYGVMGLRFSTGHVLAFRRWPASSIGPAYSSVWHQRPDGSWRTYSDVARAASWDRYLSASVRDAVHTPIRLTWLRSHQLLVQVRGTAIEWDIELRGSAFTRAFHGIRALLPGAAIHSDAVLGGMEWMAASRLRGGPVRLRGTMPNGQQHRTLPRYLWELRDARAFCEGVSLGAPEPVAFGARCGPLVLPTSGIFAFVTTRVIPASGPG